MYYADLPEKYFSRELISMKGQIIQIHIMDR